MTQKLLLESSCVFAALRPDFEPVLAKQIPPPGHKFIYCTSQYLRMEFLRLRIISAIKIYFEGRRCGDISFALYEAHHGFGRVPKTALSWASIYLAGVLKHPPSEPIEQFGWAILSLMQTYDKLLTKFVGNKTACKRGELHLDSTSPSLHQLLRDFADRFDNNERACNITKMLGLNAKDFRSLRPITTAKEDCKWSPAERKAFRKMRANLGKFICNSKSPTCATCSKVGDLLIALDQPRKIVLYHTDHAFSVLCPLLRKPHKLLSRKRA